MTQPSDVARGRDVLARWCNLAEQRLEYLTELFETGRWRRFHSEQSFLENIREAKAAVETWRNLLSREATRDNRPVDLSWIGRGRTVPPQNKLRRDPAPLQRMADVPIVPPQEIASILAGRDDSASETSAKPALEDAFAAVLD